jgi:hypothetical protein
MTEPNDMNSTPEVLLAELALQHLGIETLATRNSDSLDFHDIAVWAIRDALEAAWQVGAQRPMNPERRTTMTTTTLPSRNEAWGYRGTISRIENDPVADAAKAWDIASRRIAEVTTASPEGVRDFLDSRHGRHFADDVANELWKGETLKEAIDAAITRWMGWRIDRKTSRETGSPRGLPYLNRLRQPLRDHGRASLTTAPPFRTRRAPKGKRGSGP